MTRAFMTLFAAMAAVVQRDAVRLEKILRSVDAAPFQRVAVRHKCAGLLRAAVDDFRLKVPKSLDGLRRYAAFAMSENIALVEQTGEVRGILSGASIDHALLKGGARLASGDRAAFCTHHFDLDVLVRRSDAGRAFDALLQHAYRPSCDPARMAWYERHHHHLAPLEVAGGKPVELHVAFGLQRGVATHWEALADVLIASEDSQHRFQLGNLGQALQLLVHGWDGTRLHDTVLLAQLLRDDPSLEDRLHARLGGAVHVVGISAMLSAAGDLRGVRRRATRAANRYRLWLHRREDLPAWLRTRCQFIDAWHLNGGKLFGPETAKICEGVTPARVVGRAVTSVAAMTLASLR